MEIFYKGLSISPLQLKLDWGRQGRNQGFLVYRPRDIFLDRDLDLFPREGTQTYFLENRPREFLKHQAFCLDKGPFPREFPRQIPQKRDLDLLLSFDGVAKQGCKQGICKIFSSELGLKSGIKRGFQKGITLGGRTSANFYLMGLQNRVAKNLQNFCI